VADLPVRRSVRESMEQLEVSFSRSTDHLTIRQLAEDCRQRDDVMALMPGL
jgi:hypothetical protein